MTKKEFLLEAKTIEEANKVDTDIYRFECYSDSRDRYIFVRRRGK